MLIIKNSISALWDTYYYVGNVIRKRKTNILIKYLKAKHEMIAGAKKYNARSLSIQVVTEIRAAASKVDSTHETIKKITFRHVGLHCQVMAS